MLSYWLRKFLKISMVFTLIGSLLILACGLFMYIHLSVLIDRYLDRFIKNLNVTKDIINSQESLVPSQDYLPDELDLDNWPQFIAMVVAGFGTSLVLYSVFGLIAATSRTTDCLLLLMVIMIGSLVCQFLLFGCVVDMDCKLNIGTKDQLKFRLHERYQVGAFSNDTFTFFMNSLMLMAECCGIDGPGDFLEMGMLNYSYAVEAEYHHVPVLFPLSCCKRFYISKGFHATLACAASRDLSRINEQGCYQVVYQMIHDNYGLYIAVLFVFLILWEVLQIFAGLTILFAPSQVEKDAINKVLRAAEMDELKDYDLQAPSCGKEEMKSENLVFVPYAAVPLSDTKPETTSQIW